MTFERHCSSTDARVEKLLLTHSPDTLQTYTDLKSLGLTEGVTYYYTVCAYDRANLESGTPSANTTCDGTVRSYTIPDETAPVISAIAASPLLPNKTNQPFSVNWSLSDNVSLNGSIAVVVYRTVTSSPSTATTAAGVYVSSVGLTSVTNQVGTLEADEYFNYLIVATDASGIAARPGLHLIGRLGLSAIPQWWDAKNLASASISTLAQAHREPMLCLL